MLFKVKGRVTSLLPVLKSFLVLLVGLMLTDPILLMSLGALNNTGKEPMMCTCSTCREGPGECHCAMCHMMSHSSQKGTGEKQICDCDSRGKASMLDYYFPCYLFQIYDIIKSPKTFSGSSNLFAIQRVATDYVSGVFHPPKA